MRGKKRNKSGPLKGHKFQKGNRSVLVMMTFLLITVMVSAAAYALEGRLDIDAGAGSMNYYQQEVAETEGELGNVGSDGQAHYSYKIGAVSINYSSESGWSVGGYGVISRSTKNGVPKYDDSPTGGEIYELSGEELVYIGTGSDSAGSYREFRTKRESFQKVKFYNGTDSYWAVNNPDGSKAFYRKRMYAQGGNSDLHHGLPRAWGVSEVRGRGDYDVVSYDYVDWEGEYYLHKVISGKTNAASDGYAATILTWVENTNYQKKYSYRTGSRVLIDGCILQQVENYMGTDAFATLNGSGDPVQGHLAEACAVLYLENQITNSVERKRKPLIKEIIRFGEYRLAIQPPITFAYHDLNMQIAPEAERIVHQMDDRELRASGVWDRLLDDNYGYYADFMDMNNDGLPDRVYQATNENNMRVWYNNGTGFSARQDCPADENSMRKTILTESSHYLTTHDYFDINGDGIPDRVRKEPDQSFKVRLGNGSSFGPETTWSGGKIDEGRYIRSHVYMNTYADFIDMNGDGLPDQVVWEPGTMFTLIHVYLNTGSGLATTPIYWAPNLPVWEQHNFEHYRLRHIETIVEHPSVDEKGSNISGQLMDMNGDGLPDYVVKHTAVLHRNDENEEEDLEDHSKLIVCYNNGRGFEDPVQWNATDNACLADMYMDGAQWISGDGWDYMDMNNDGLPDRVAKNIVEEIEWDGNDQKVTHYRESLHVAFNNGNGFDKYQFYSDETADRFMLRHDMICSEVTGNPKFTGVFADYIDINGDGFPDRLMKAPPRVFINNTEYVTAIFGLPNTNGDLYVYLNKVASAGPPDLLKSIENGQGGKTSYTYQPLNKTDNPRCKTDMWVVQTERSSDGMGNTLVTSYEFQGGVYDVKEHEFLGFERIKKTGPTGDYKWTMYHIDSYRKGMPVHVWEYTADNALFNETVYYHDTQVLTVSGNDTVKFYPLTHQYQSVFDGNSASNVFLINYEYDSYGNITKTVEDDRSVNDKRITHNWYNVNNTGANWDLRQLKESIVVGYDKDRVLRLQSGTYYQYDSAGNPTHTYNWLDGATPYPVESNGGLTRPSGSDSRWVLRERRYYDSYGNVNRIKDARGNSSYTTYDLKFGAFPVKKVNALGHTIWNYYDVPASYEDEGAISNQITFGRLVQVTDKRNGLTNRMEYDHLGRVVKKIRMDFSSTNPNEEIVYTDAVLDESTGEIQTPASVATIRRPSPGPEGPDNVFLYSYNYMDGLGRMIQTKSDYDVGHYSVVDTYYNIVDKKNETRVSAPYLDVWSAGYSPRDTSQPQTVTLSWLDGDEGRKQTVTGTDGSVTTTTVRDTETAVTDPEGNTSRTVANRFGQTLQAIDANGVITEYTYETGSGNLIEVKDFCGNKITSVYNTLGQKMRVSDPDLGTTSYTYDLNGNMVSRTDAKRQTVTYEYDELNRLTLTTYPGVGNTDVFGYDTGEYGAGKLGQTYVYRNNERQEEQAFSYDQYGNVVHQYHWLDVGRHSGTHYQHDGMGRPVSATYNDAEQYLYRYDWIGPGLYSIKRQNDGYQLLYECERDFSGKPVRMRLNGGDGFNVNYNYWAYDQVGADMLKRMFYVGPGIDFVQRYSYDRNGNVLSINDGVNSSYNQSFTYDSLNRMVAANGNGLYGEKTYVYDGMGNMISKEGTSFDYGRFSGKGNKPHAVKNDGTYIYQYDANGNLVEKRAIGALPEGLINIPANVLNYNLYGLDKVALYDRAQLNSAVGGYGQVGSPKEINLAPNAKAGTVIAEDKIILSDYSGVYGDVLTRPGKLTQYNNVYVGGLINNVMGMDDMLPEVTANNIDFTGTPQTDTYVNSGQTATLAPGKYWNYTVHANGDLNLTSGVYYFNTLRMDSNARLNLDETSGPVKIYVQGLLQMRAGTVHSKTGREGTASLLIGYIGTQDVYLGGATRFDGTVIAPNAKLIAGQEQNKVFEGMFIGKEVHISNDVQVICVPFVGLVPEIWHYSYDWNNKLIKVEHNYETIMTSVYGISGNRIKKSENGTDTYYYFPEYEEKWNGTTLAGSSLYHFVDGKRIAKENEAGEFCFYISDHLGSNSIILNESEQPVKTARYLPYGVSIASGTHQDDKGFNGKDLDSTGLYNYGARFYDPNLGRFITADTATPGGGFDLQGLNRYSYCLNNPVKYVDPTGNIPIWAPIAVYYAAVYGPRIANSCLMYGDKITTAIRDGMIISALAGSFFTHAKYNAREGYSWLGLTIKSATDVISIPSYLRWSQKDAEKLYFDIVTAVPFNGLTWGLQQHAAMLTNVTQKALKAGTVSKWQKTAYVALNTAENTVAATWLGQFRDMYTGGEGKIDPFVFWINLGLQFTGGMITVGNPEDQQLRNIASVSKKVGRQIAYSLSDVFSSNSGTGSGNDSGVGISGLGLELQSDFDWTPDWMLLDDSDLDFDWSEEEE